MFRDFSEIMDADEIVEREAILAEFESSDSLCQMAEMVEAKDVDGEFTDLVEAAFIAGANNPLSEAAEDLRQQLLDALKELR